MILKTRQAGDPVLRQQAKTVGLAQLKTDKLQTLIDAMIETLRDHPGVGLAAPQVGENLQIIVIEDTAKYQAKLPKVVLLEQERVPVKLTVIMNPKLTVTDNTQAEYFEGCLSIPGYRALVKRAKQVTVSGLDRHGKPIEIKAKGWYARILQHEIDHLSRALYIDTMNSRSFISEKEFALHWVDKLAKDFISITNVAK